MFKEKLSDALRPVQPDAALRERIREQLAQDTNSTSVPAPSSAPVKRPIHRMPVRTIAALLSLCLVCLSVWGVATKLGKMPEIKSPSGQANATISAVPGTISYHDIYTLFSSIKDTGNDENGIMLDGEIAQATEETTAEAVPEEAPAKGANGTASTPAATEDASEDATEKSDYSTTNTQVNGVDEADITKTDGKYIYQLNRQSNTVFIVRADSGKLVQTAKIELDTARSSNDTVRIYCHDMYVSGNRLALIMTRFSAPQDKKASDIYGTTEETALVLYDITSPEQPALLQTLAQSGSYISSRLCGNIAYVFTDQSFYYHPKKADVSTYVPMLCAGEDKEPVPEDSVYRFDGTVDRRYLTVSSMDVKTAKRLDAKTVLGGGDTVYATDSSLYVAAGSMLRLSADAKHDSTRLIYFSVSDGKLTPAAQGVVDGAILNQFSMDEYKDHFRIVTTVSEIYQTPTVTSGSDAPSGTTSSSAEVQSAVSTDIAYVTDARTTNALFVLDKMLKTVGSLTGLAENERVYSVRFAGDTGYFVTFRQVDPLFAVDLSNPSKPALLSALKIPGFSNYLHPFADGLLLGIGQDADAQTGRAGKAKLSMFNVSDPRNVTEQQKHLLDCNYTQASMNHKAVLVDTEKNLIGFAGNDYDSDYYYLFGYFPKEGFRQKAKLKVPATQGYEIRGLYIGDYLYVCSAENITAYSLQSFEETSALLLY